MARDIRMPVGVDISVDIVEGVDRYVQRTKVTKRLVYETALRRFLLEEEGKKAGGAAPPRRGA